MQLVRYILSAALFSILYLANSQNIQNSGFENWFEKQYYEDPDQFASTNFASYTTSGSPNVMKTSDAHSGSHAVKLETIPSSEGNISGAIFIGSIGDGFVAGGIPFNTRPDSVVGYVKYNVLPLDTANIILLFKKFGAPLGICLIQFYGTKNNYTRFSAPVQWLIPIIPPDSLATVITSSSIFSFPVTGSTITVDDIGLIGVSTSYPNHGFENWTNYSSEEPEDWFTSNIFSLSLGTNSVVKSTDSYEGDNSIRIQSTLTSWGDTLGFITNGTFGEDGPTGGMPVDSVPDILSGYYKYEPVGTDTALVRMTLYRFNQNIGMSEVLEDKIIKLPPASEYTYFEMQSDYFSLQVPDTLNIAFGSGNFDDNGSFIGLGSTLYLDALDITYRVNTVGTINPVALDIVHFYPNPASKAIYFEVAETSTEVAEIAIIDSKGIVLYADKYHLSPRQKNKIDITHLPSGFYFVKLNSMSQTYFGKIMVK